MQLLAKIISVIFHPMLMSTYGTIMLFNTGAEYPYLGFSHQLYLLGFIVLVTFLIPLSMVPVYFGFGLIRSVYMTTHRERTLPLMVSSISFWLGYGLLARVYPDKLLLNLLIISGLIVFLAGLISYFWKISAHLMGLGGAVALSVYASWLLQVNTSKWLIFFLLASGITAFARLYLGAHTPRQVWTGFLMSFMLFGLGMWILQ